MQKKRLDGETIVVKIGTSALTNKEGQPDPKLLGRLVDQIVDLKRDGAFVVLVSSGAVGTGRSRKGLSVLLRQASDEVSKQILAGIGQPRLMTLYGKLLDKHACEAAQILLTMHDFNGSPSHPVVTRLFEGFKENPNILPIVNENDSTSTQELMFTDNDQLAGMLAKTLGAKKLILLSNIDGVSDKNPLDPTAVLYPVIDWNDPACPRPSTAGKSNSGRGGMESKLHTAHECAKAGIETVIANARTPFIIEHIMNGVETDLFQDIVAGTVFEKDANLVWNRKQANKAKPKKIKRPADIVIGTRFPAITQEPQRGVSKLLAFGAWGRKKMVSLLNG